MENCTFDNNAYVQRIRLNMDIIPTIECMVRIHEAQ